MKTNVSWEWDEHVCIDTVPEFTLIHAPGIGTGVKRFESDMFLIIDGNGKQIFTFERLPRYEKVKVLPKGSTITLTQE